MARKPRKARVEGAVAKPEPAIIAEVEPLEVAPPITFGEQNTAPKLANPVPGDDGDALDRIVASFRERFPEEWENIRLCPLQHGIPAMADILRGRG